MCMQDIRSHEVLLEERPVKGDKAFQVDESLLLEETTQTVRHTFEFEAGEGSDEEIPELKERAS